MPTETPSKLCIRALYDGEIKCLELEWNAVNAIEFTKKCKTSDK